MNPARELANRPTEPKPQAGFDPWLLRLILAVKGMTPGELARKLKIDPSQVSRALNYGAPFSSNRCDKVAKLLDCKRKDFWSTTEAWTLHLGYHNRWHRDGRPALDAWVREHVITEPAPGLPTRADRVVAAAICDIWHRAPARRGTAYTGQTAQPAYPTPDTSGAASSPQGTDAPAERGS